MPIEVDEYAYSASRGRYYSLTTGRFVSAADVNGLLQTYHDGNMTRLSEFAGRVASGQASTQDLQNAMVSYLAESHATMYALGRGGVQQMEASDFERLSERLEQEYNYLVSFMADIDQGKVSEAQMKVRLAMYGEAVWGSFWEGESAGAEAVGFTQERRIAKDDKGTCDKCKGYAERGWVEIGTLPKPGQLSPCLSRCRCQMEQRRKRRGKWQIRRAA